VSDEALRALEREVKANPTDLRAGRELLRALERTGATARAREELVRLARVGDADARSKVAHEGAPRPGLHEAGVRRGVAHPERARKRVQRVGLDHFARLLGATDDLLLFADRERTVAIDAVTLAERWTLVPPCAAAALGRRVSFQLVGPVIRAVNAIGRRLGGFECEGHPLRYAAHGDQGVFILDVAGQYRLVALEAGRSEPTWSQPVACFEADLALVPERIALAVRTLREVGGRTGEPGPSQLVCLDAASGAPRWQRDFPGSIYLQAADVLGFLVSSPEGVFHLDAGTAKETVFAPQSALVMARTDFEHVLVGARRRLELFERATGKMVWAVPNEAVQVGDSLLAGAHVWTVVSDEPGRMTVAALSGEDGRVVASWEETIPTEHDLTLTLVPLDGAVVACAVFNGSALLLRIEEG
jgi:outer membrane protein assembly factor BamB